MRMRDKLEQIAMMKGINHDEKGDPSQALPYRRLAAVIWWSVYTANRAVLLVVE